MIAPDNHKTSLIQSLFRIILGGFLVLAGISHLTVARLEFQAQVPHWVPMNTNLVVILSGIVEILLGAALISLSKYKTKVGWVVAIFFILVFPGNIAQYLNHADGFGLDSDSKRLVRLFFQPVLILWALWATGAFDKKNKRIKETGL